MNNIEDSFDFRHSPHTNVFADELLRDGVDHNEAELLNEHFELFAGERVLPHQRVHRRSDHDGVPAHGRRFGAYPRVEVPGTQNAGLRSEMNVLASCRIDRCSLSPMCWPTEARSVSCPPTFEVQCEELGHLSSSISTRLRPNRYHIGILSYLSLKTYSEVLK